MPATFQERVRALAAERGWSLEQVTLRAWQPDTTGPSASLIRKALSGDRTLTPAVIEAVAAAFGVPPDTFGEYRLHLARDLYDERTRGLEAALANLSLLEQALQEADAAAGEHEAPPASDHERHLQPAKPASGQTGQAAS